MHASVRWKNKLAFDGKADSNYTIPLDSSEEAGGENTGLRPLELLAIGLAGCTGMDVISILKKKRQDVTDFEVKVFAQRAESHPRVFTYILVEFIVTGHAIELQAVERAVELSVTRYCSAQAMLIKAVPIEHKITMIEAE
jgi:putative redox protein